jgi:hypothetical protein
MISSGVLSPYMLVMSGCLWFNKKKKQKKFWGNWYVEPFKTVPTRDIRNSVHEKVTEFGAEFLRNFSQFRTEYGIDGSKKNRRNSVSTEFRGHPHCVPYTTVYRSVWCTVSTDK